MDSRIICDEIAMNNSSQKHNIIHNSSPHYRSQIFSSSTFTVKTEETNPVKPDLQLVFDSQKRHTFHCRGQSVTGRHFFLLSPVSHTHSWDSSLLAHELLVELATHPCSRNFSHSLYSSLFHMWINKSDEARSADSCALLFWKYFSCGRWLRPNSRINRREMG